MDSNVCTVLVSLLLYYILISYLRNQNKIKTQISINPIKAIFHITSGILVAFIRLVTNTIDKQ